MAPTSGPGKHSAGLPTASRWLSFLADDMRVPHRGRTALAQVRKLFQHEDPVKDFVACNLLTLLLFRHGNTAIAQALCRAEIVAGNKNQCFKIYALQAQVNLLRIEGLAGDPDAALAALSGLEPVADGRPAQLPELEIDERCLDPLSHRGAHRIRELARAVRVVDTCKILWRHDRRDELVAQAREFMCRWPDLRAGAEPHHAGEADWLVGAPDRAPLTLEAGTDALGLPARRLQFIRSLHEAAILADAGERDTARKMAVELLNPAARPPGPYMSAVTPARWLGSLADTLLRTDAHEEAAEALLEAEGIARQAGDGVLRSQLRRLMGKEPFPERVPHAPGSGQLARSDLAEVVELAWSRLGTC